MGTRGWEIGRWPLAAAAAMVVALGAFGLTASNTVAATRAGDGSGAITGYVVSAVSYTLNASNPSNLDSVAFSVDSAPVAGSTLRVRLSAAGAWYACTFVGTAVTCSTTAPQATVASTDTLRVVIAQ